MIDKKKIVFIILVVVVIIVGTAILLKSVFKNYKTKCVDENHLFDKKLNICRDICDYDKDPKCDGSCTHYDQTIGECNPCPKGTSWDGNQCKFNCNNRGTYDTVEKKCDCKGSPSENYPAINPDPTKLPPNGWTGDNCTKSLNKCLGVDGKPGTPLGLTNFPIWSPTGKIISQTAAEKITCSGNGLIMNNSDYSACKCECDKGWKGVNCNTPYQGSCGTTCDWKPSGFSGNCITHNNDNCADNTTYKKGKCGGCGVASPCTTACGNNPCECTLNAQKPLIKGYEIECKKDNDCKNTVGPNGDIPNLLGCAGKRTPVCAKSIDTKDSKKYCKCDGTEY